MEFLDSLFDAVLGLPTWAVWLSIVLATFVSEDLTCVAAGLLAARGDLPAAQAIGAAGLGIFLGDLGLYWAGHALGRPALRRAPIAWLVHDEDVLHSARWFERRGPVVILLGRFVPGTRLPTYFASGLLGIGFWRFAAYALLAVLVWAPLLGGAALVLGRGILPWIEHYESWALVLLIGAALGLWLLVKLVLPVFTWRGRRMIVSRWQRLTQWEFWPPWLFYPPVVVYVFWLALRHRSLSLLTAVNPGLPAGGFVGESKAHIMDELDGREGDVAATCLLSGAATLEERLARLAAFVEERGLDWPLVLKPDAGQRGSGVAVVRDIGAARAYLERARVDCVAQEHCPGREYGVFYYRRPSEVRGRVFSITTKLFPRVVGDGARTLEQLILSDPRAVSLARLYLEQNVGRLAHVPAAGQEVQLVEIGNHCRGAIFLDGSHLCTHELEARIERVSRRFEGFYFGRYDVVVPSEEHLRRGEGLKVIELNGATSEATHIYDPRYGVLSAWRTLFRQWRILFEIAAENRARGAQLVHWTELLRMLSHYRAAARNHPRTVLAP
ncbi:MAG TPA: VTT domain-containing protein [Planctomycetota bacterium]|nr:VTT domain-containing protein [Planctomycetota bacterium]